MNYIRIDYKGNMQPLREENLVDFISDDNGFVLVVTGQHERSKALYEDLKENIQPLKCNPRELYLEGERSRIAVCSRFDWPMYMSLQLSSAYIHRDGNIDFLFKIMSKCRFAPELML